jgi:hypothetical protein
VTAVTSRTGSKVDNVVQQWGEASVVACVPPTILEGGTMVGSGHLRRAAALLCASLGIAAPASAVVEVDGTEAHLAWAPASGPVAMYLVYVSTNGGAPVLARYRLSNDTGLYGEPGDTITVAVQAVGQSGVRGPRSLDSEPIHFKESPPDDPAPPPDDPAPPPDDPAPPPDDPAPPPDDPAPPPDDPAPPPDDPAPPPDDPAPPPDDPAPAENPALPHDFDGDGTPDLLMRDPAGTLQAQLVSVPTDGVQTPAVGDPILVLTLAADETVVGNGDYDGDGFADLLTHDTAAGQLVLTRLEDTQPVDSAAFDLAAGWRVVASADFDGDGRSDIVVRNADLDATEIWLMLGLSISQVVELPPGPAAGSVVAAGDADADGRAELVWRAGSDLLAWSLDGSDAISEQPLVSGLGSEWQPVGTCDVDADGRTDFVFHRASPGELRAVHFPSGVPTSTRIDILSSFGLSSRVVLAADDFDADGDCDLVMRSTWALWSTSIYRLSSLTQQGTAVAFTPANSSTEVGVGGERPPAP